MASRPVLAAFAAMLAGCLSPPAGQPDAASDPPPVGDDGGSVDANPECTTIVHDDFDSPDPFWTGDEIGGGTRLVGDGVMTLSVAPPDSGFAYAGMWSDDDFEPRDTRAIMQVQIDRTTGGEFWFEVKTLNQHGVGLLMVGGSLKGFAHDENETVREVLCSPCPSVPTEISSIWLAIEPSNDAVALSYSEDGVEWDDVAVGPALTEIGSYYTAVQAFHPEAATARLHLADWKVCPP